MHISTLVDGPEHFVQSAGLVEPRAAKPQLAQVLQHIVGIQHAAACTTAKRARISEWEIVARGDIVVAKSNDGSTVVGFVDFHGCIAVGDDSLCLTCIKLLDLESSQLRKQTWTRSDKVLAVPTSDVQTALLWADVGEGKVVTLKTIR